MTTSYKELVAQRDVLQQQIEIARRAERRDALSQVREILHSHGLTQDDVFPRKKGTSVIRPVAPKYRDPLTGLQWTGRGKEPAWIRGQDRSQFRIG